MACGLPVLEWLIVETLKFVARIESIVGEVSGCSFDLVIKWLRLLLRFTGDTLFQPSAPEAAWRDWPRATIWRYEKPIATTGEQIVFKTTVGSLAYKQIRISGR